MNPSSTPTDSQNKSRPAVGALRYDALATRDRVNSAARRVFNLAVEVLPGPKLLEAEFRGLIPRIISPSL
jgi:hypothetical protein